MKKKASHKSTPAEEDEEHSPLLSNLISFVTTVGSMSSFTVNFFKQVFLPPYEFKEVIRQSYSAGYKSLPLVGITGFIMGLVLTVQSRPTLEQFGAVSMIPGMVAISIVREIGPVITALICAGKTGSSIGAELASMKVTEQIDAMEVSGINAFKFLVITRILATTIMIPVLVVFSDTLAMYGGYIGSNIKGAISLHLFFSQVINSLSFKDIFPAFVKTFFFGFAIGLVGCYEGYNSNKGTEGVGISANTAVVIGSLLIFIIDMIAVQITDMFQYAS